MGLADGGSGRDRREKDDPVLTVTATVESLPLRRSASFTNDVIIVDGLWGTGKSLVAPIISGMDGIEKQRFEHSFEWLCTLDHLGRLSRDATVTMLQTYADLVQYNNLIGREVNLRWADDSGLRANPNSLRYLGRLFQKDGDAIVERIESQNLALSVMSHMILLVGDPLFEAFGERLRLVHVVRHPVYTVGHWVAFLRRFDAKRTFNLAFDHAGCRVPWFAFTWADEYAARPLHDRALLSVIRLYEALFAAVDRSAAQARPMLVEPFEAIALETEPFLKRLATFLGRGHGRTLKRTLRAQKLPRERLLQGTGKAQYGWTPAPPGTERDDYHRLFEKIVADSPSCRASFMPIIEEYNRRWPSVLNAFHSSSS